MGACCRKLRRCLGVDSGELHGRLIADRPSNSVELTSSPTSRFDGESHERTTSCLSGRSTDASPLRKLTEHSQSEPRKTAVFQRLQSLLAEHFPNSLDKGSEGKLDSERKFDLAKLVLTRCVAIDARYEIVRELGAGAQGKTYQVKRKENGVDYVAKEQKASSEGGAVAFKNEFEKMRDFRHPNCIKVFELLESPADSTLFIISELAHGGDLYRYMNVVVENVGLTEEHVSQLFYQALAGVAFLHSNDCVHNDLKPDNILVMEKYSSGRIPRVVIGDYGCATLRSKTQIVFGDPRYQAPESLRQLSRFLEDQDTPLLPNMPKQDVWSMGVLLYEILSSGIIPFAYKRCLEPLVVWDDETWVALRKELLDAAHVKVRPFCEGASDKAESILKRLLTKDPEDRPGASEAMSDPWFSVKGKQFTAQQEASLCFTASKNNVRQILLNGLAAEMQIEHKKSCFGIFNEFDVDHLGFLDKDAFRRALEVMGHDTQSADEIFDRADVTKTGTLEFNEFVALTYDWRSVDKVLLDTLLDEFLISLDAKKNGTISQEGLAKLFSGAVPAEELEDLRAVSSSLRDLRSFVLRASFFSPELNAS